METKEVTNNLEELAEKIIKSTEENFDSVNRPKHYTEGRKFEPIEVIEDWNLGFCMGNALKYISRSGRKTSGTLSDKEKEIEDLNKAIWYINRRIKEVNEGR